MKKRRPEKGSRRGGDPRVLKLYPSRTDPIETDEADFIMEKQRIARALFETYQTLPADQRRAKSAALIALTAPYAFMCLVERSLNDFQRGAISRQQALTEIRRDLEFYGTSLHLQALGVLGIGIDPDHDPTISPDGPVFWLDPLAGTEQRMLSAIAYREMCECGCSRALHHGLNGHLHCSVHENCQRFLWTHFDGDPTR